MNLKLIYSKSPARQEVKVGDTHILRDGYAYEITNIRTPSIISKGCINLVRVQSPHDCKEILPVEINAVWIKQVNYS